MVTRDRSGEGGPPVGALPRLTRRRFLVGAGKAAAGLAAIGALGSPARATPRFPSVDQFDAEVPTAWFELALDLVRTTPGYSPPVASRALGYAGVTLYESLLPGMDGFRSLAGLAAGLEPLPAAGKNAAYDWPAVAGPTPAGASSSRSTRLLRERRLRRFGDDAAA